MGINIHPQLFPQAAVVRRPVFRRLYKRYPRFSAASDGMIHKRISWSVAPLNKIEAVARALFSNALSLPSRRYPQLRQSRLGVGANA
jgi:hypothetical protein